MLRPIDGVFRPIPYMGVIYVVAEAEKLGFVNGHPDWCNLGQGQPEVGPMDGAPARYDAIRMEPLDHAYGPVGGVDELREAVAAHYNRLYRTDKRSQYRKENVSIASGGRLVLARMFAGLGSINVGYQTPDYTAYEDMLDYHRHRFTPVHLPAAEANGFMLTPAELDRAVDSHGLGAFVVSNPCNPTGQVVHGDALARYVDIGRTRGCAMILDEFYSHFVYTPDGEPGAGPVSAAAYVEDVDEDPVLLIDGGPGRPMQRAAVAALEPARADQETAALRRGFAAKRNVMVRRLREMGIRPARDSEATFYVWASLEDLPAPFDDADHFFREALTNKVMTVPGRFFDVNPGQARRGRSRFHAWMRFSFGPPMDNMVMGLDRLEAMLSATSARA